MAKTTRAHKEVKAEGDAASTRAFMRNVLADLRALDRMLIEKRFEKGVRRIGAELEMFLTDKAFQAAPASLKMLEKIDDPHFTTELGLFQLEMNADPQKFGTDGFARMEKQMTALLEKTRAAAMELGLHAVLVGILPSLKKSDLGLDNMVPNTRYRALSKAVQKMRGGDFEFSIKGHDELVIAHDSVMVEACNSSFQVHLQVDADDFARQYNLAQVLAGPLLSTACNSPLLFGKRLWSETRIALFQQAVDTRSKVLHQRDAAARVTFGTKYVRKSIVEIFQEDIARFRALVGSSEVEDAMAVLDAGKTPQLKALRLHNGTIYRWNRACYGIIDNKPHLRIENRVMPSGPSVLDSIANSAFWCGMMVELSHQYEDITQHIDFDTAQGNFYAAAREGISSQQTWLDGEELAAPKLVLDKLLPLAEAGLRRQGIDDGDVKRYLGVVEQRIRTGRTGARWMNESLHRMKNKGTSTERNNALVAATVQRQATGRPVSEWEHARLDEATGTRNNYQYVEQCMTTDLFTVEKDDAVEVVANLMGWERIRHVMVEDKRHKLIGLVSYRAVLRFLTGGGVTADIAVSDIMKKDVITVTPQTPSLDAIRLMRRYRVGCLPVLRDGQLVGVLTEENFLKMSADLLEAALSTET